MRSNEGEAMSEFDPTVPEEGVSVVLEEPRPNGRHNGAGEEAAASLLDEVVMAVQTVGDEPTAKGDFEASALIGAGEAVAEPAAAVAKALVRGRYRSSGGAWIVELRVDVDGPRAMNRVSADYYSVSGGTVSYFGSLRLDAATITWAAGLVTITGTGSYTFGTSFPKIKVTIPRVDTGQPNAAATLRFYNSANQPGAVYICNYVSPRFRTVLLEEDSQQGVTPFTSYNTGSLPSGGTARNLSVISAYAEAGIQLLSTGRSNIISAVGNPSWSDAELHAAMQANFSRFANIAQWAVWLMHAKLHDRGPGLYGIMFDQQGKQRQGSAVFYQSLAGTTAAQKRLQLYTCVHELGHAFNLLHSWQKSLATPPAPNRPASPSWMNYPWNFPGGEGAFWSAFPFTFDSLEVIHLRHGYRDNVIMGGNPFATGAALEREAGWADPEQDESGLSLSIKAPRSLPYGVPAAVDLELRATTERGTMVPTVLGPRPSTVDIAIGKPNGSATTFSPLLHHCRGEEDKRLLRVGEEPVRDSAFIHYGEDGFVFDQPGMYKLRARYIAGDGSIVLSNVTTLLVQSPVSHADNEVAALAFGDEQGTLMSLLGSDDPGLRRGNDALLEIIERHPEHPVAAAARVVIGTNAAREFKAVSSDGSVSLRPPRAQEAAELLGEVFDLDTARAAASGAEDAAAASQAIASELPQIGTDKEVSSAIDAFIRSRIDEIAVEIAEL
jgi:hypothetical protein